MKKLWLFISVGLFVFAMTTASDAVMIEAYTNSLWHTPLDTGIMLNSGDTLTVSVDFNDMWSAGNNIGGDRTSNADGLGNPFGHDFGFYTYGNLSTRYGTLVGQIGSGDYFVIGTSFNGVVSDSGALSLIYWDSNYSDNFDSVWADIGVTSANPIPEPGALVLLGTGLVGIAAYSKKRK